MILKEIRNSYILARQYVERCCITVNQDGKEIQAFPEFEGKARVTHWGGTSSAIYLLNQIKTSGNSEFVPKLEKASNWLVQDQAIEGSWEAAEIRCCEATAAVIYDLKDVDLLNEEQLKRAIDFIQLCYVKGEGYFLTRPGVEQMPHLYSTFLAVRALAVSGNNVFSVAQQKEIIEWVMSVKAADGNWGATRHCTDGDVAHTIFALFILYYCNIDVDRIKKDFQKQIKWLKRKIESCSTINESFSYEAIEVYDESKTDEYGKLANILKIYHFNLALLCSFFLIINQLGISQRLIKRMILIQGSQGGWGINSDNKMFIWATQQAIDCMVEFESRLFKNGDTLISKIRSIIYSIPFFGLKFLTILIVLPIIWFLIDIGKGGDIILSVITCIVPWLFKMKG